MIQRALGGVPRGCCTKWPAHCAGLVSTALGWSGCNRRPMHVRHWNRLRTWIEEYMWKISTSLGDFGDLLLEFLWKIWDLPRTSMIQRFTKFAWGARGWTICKMLLAHLVGMGSILGIHKCTCFLSSILPIAIAYSHTRCHWPCVHISSYFHREEDGRYSVAHSQYAATPHQHESLSCRIWDFPQWPGDDLAMTWRSGASVAPGLAATLLRLKEVLWLL